mgnify:CR=1 FL=1
MPRFLTLLFTMLTITFGIGLMAGCPPTDDDDSGGAEGTDLCSGPGCSNSNDCPIEEPAPGDLCDFTGNCHYCEQDTAATGYTCDGTSFTDQGVFDCTQSN